MKCFSFWLTSLCIAGSRFIHLSRMDSNTFLFCCCSVASDSLWPHGLQQTRLPCPSLSPGVCSNLCPLSQWCHPTISSSVTPFSFCFSLSQHQGLFQWVVLFTLGDQIIEAATSASVLPMNIEDWFPLGLTGLISLLSFYGWVILHCIYITTSLSIHLSMEI